MRHSRPARRPEGRSRILPPPRRAHGCGRQLRSVTVADLAPRSALQPHEAFDLPQHRRGIDRLEQVLDGAAVVRRLRHSRIGGERAEEADRDAAAALNLLQVRSDLVRQPSGSPPRNDRAAATYDRGAVLVVDDDFDTRASVSELPYDLGYWPMTMRNGLEALEYLRLGGRPAAMLIDLYMPLMDGEAFCAACDADERLVQIPRILISANPDASRRTAVCRATAFLSKPVSEADLELVLRALPK